MSDLTQRIVAGDVRAVARACRLIDERSAEREALLRALHAHTGRSRVIGVTGSPGSGKSTLVDRVIERFRARGERVAVIAIDPSSPFSGGALLGDRIRMQRHAADSDVFIRSLGTRGAHGGLSRSAAEMVSVFDAWGANVVLIETVGVGQVELDVLGVADSVVVVVVPGMGDDVQANKAGIIEIGDVFVLNKADRDGADATHRELQVALSLGSAPMRASRSHHSLALPIASDTLDAPPIVRTVATLGTGIDELIAAVDKHASWLRDTDAGKARTQARQRARFERASGDALTAAILELFATQIESLAADVAARRIDPYSAITQLLDDVKRRLR